MSHGTNVHDEEESGQPFAVSDDLVLSVDQRISERQCPNLHMNFHKVLYEVITNLEQNGFQKCSWVRSKCRQWLQL
jgi:hypothetical protein